MASIPEQVAEASVSDEGVAGQLLWEVLQPRCFGDGHAEWSAERGAPPPTWGRARGRRRSWQRGSTLFLLLNLLQTGHCTNTNIFASTPDRRRN